MKDCARAAIVAVVLLAACGADPKPSRYVCTGDCTRPQPELRVVAPAIRAGRGQGNSVSYRATVRIGALAPATGTSTSYRVDADLPRGE